MKFLLIVLAIHLVVEALTGKKNKNSSPAEGEMNDPVRHPAEYELR